MGIEQEFFRGLRKVVEELAKQASAEPIIKITTDKSTNKIVAEVEFSHYVDVEKIASEIRSELEQVVGKYDKN